MPRRERRTLQDVADEAGLSLAATSYALRGERGSAQTIERVRALADALGYSVDPSARALASGRTGTIGVCGSLRDLWQQDLSVMVARALRDGGRHATIADAGADPAVERQVVAQFAAQRVDGVVCSPVDPEAEHWNLLDSGTAVVSLGDALSARPGSAAVLFDNERGIRDALGHLHALGHHRVAVLDASPPSTPGRPSRLLAVQVARELGMEPVEVAAPASLAGASAAAVAAFSTADRPTAAFCLSDSLAFGVYRAAAHLGLSVPDELSVVGFDDHQLAPLVAPPLTSTAWDEDAIAAAAVRMLDSLLAGEAPEAVPAFVPELVARGSTAPPPPARRGAPAPR